MHGLSFSNIQNNVTPRLRGIGSSTAEPGIEPGVAVYVDGVYYASATGALFSFNNVEQVSVLKGPQGTLFGRNAVAGMVQVAIRRRASRWKRARATAITTPRPARSMSAAAWRPISRSTLPRS